MALSGTDVLSLKFIDCTSDFGIGPLNGKDDEYELGYSGYMYSYPDWFIRKKSAYKALRDALKQSEEFMDDIKSLL